MTARWTLVFSAMTTCKDRYKGKSGSSWRSGSQDSSDVRREEGVSEAGMCLTRTMRKRCKILDGKEFFEIHKNESVGTTEDPTRLCHTCRSRGEVVRHLVWGCPHLE